jgi:hypothetical protein
MTTTRNLIDAIASKDATAIEGAFNVAMAEKISGQLETMRQEVAHNMFKTAQETATEE